MITVTRIAISALRTKKEWETYWRKKTRDFWKTVVYISDRQYRPTPEYLRAKLYVGLQKARQNSVSVQRCTIIQTEGEPATWKA